VDKEQSIKNIVICSPAEALEHMRYLQGTPVRWAVDCLRSGRAVLKKGTITSLTALGNMRTILADFGGIPLPPEQDRTLVRQIYPWSQRPDFGGPRREVDRASLAEFMQWDENGSLEPHIKATITLHRGRYALIDGNKRAAVFHANRERNGTDDIGLPVHIVDIPG
jgi:hypothetical protein